MPVCERGRSTARARSSMGRCRCTTVRSRSRGRTSFVCACSLAGSVALICTWPRVICPSGSPGSCQGTRWWGRWSHSGARSSTSRWVTEWESRGCETPAARAATAWQVLRTCAGTPSTPGGRTMAATPSTRQCPPSTPTPPDRLHRRGACPAAVRRHHRLPRAGASDAAAWGPPRHLRLRWLGTPGCSGGHGTRSERPRDDAVGCRA